MNKQNELLKIAAAKIAYEEFKKDAGGLAGMLSLLGLGGGAYTLTRLFPRQWGQVKQWFQDMANRGDRTPEEEDATDRAYYEGGGLRPYSSNVLAETARNLANRGRGNALKKKVLGAPSASGKGRKLLTHEVQGGDTLYDLANQYYGNAADYDRIFRANPQLTDPNLIYTGDELRIPRA